MTEVSNMVFSAPEFIFLYLTVTLLLYYTVPLVLRNMVLFILSFIFYGWGEPVYVFLMIATIAADYVFGYFVDKYSENKRLKKRFLVLSVIFNLAILGFFKYYDFVIANLRLIPGLSNLPLLGISLPIGISFYTFQAMSYVIDVYRKDARVQKNPLDFGLYVTLFPQLIAGPIVRYQDVDLQLRTREHSLDKFSAGIRTFIAGLGKKVLLANMAGELWEYFRDIPDAGRTSLASWMGIIFYTFQIYFDFSGYSDMAIGLGRMFGFEFIENFNYPYISGSITEFWRRWHISLSTWFREYVYIPLGGNRKGELKTYRNILIVWFLTGFWHGASWNYIMWGLYYCALLIIEKAFLGKLLKRLPVIFSHIYTIFFVVIGWLLFVFEDLGAGMRYLKVMFTGGEAGFADASTIYELARNALFIIIMIAASTPLPKKLWNKWTTSNNTGRIAGLAGCFVILLVSVAYLIESSFNPFLYFRF